MGFRPFIVRLARQYEQNGWITNTSEGVAIAIEGLFDQQQEFLFSLNNNLPPLAEIRSLSVTQQALQNFADFQIKDSISDGKRSTFVLPDMAICPDCTDDIFNPASRYYHYPFTSCCHCGPRYSIMIRQPYDRQQTSMLDFTICHDCETDYQSIDNRRFHAQTIACPNCGPQIKLLDPGGQVLAESRAALSAAINALQSGKIVAIKSIGGYQLLADATHQQAIERLRQRKNRPHKPFALMVSDLAAAQQICCVNEMEQVALASPAAPIVLLKRRETPNLGNNQSTVFLLAPGVAPDSNLLGVMLAYTPLHHLLLHDLGFPVVATSGNIHNEPICFEDQQALTRLGKVADCFLIHNRPILRPVDDSIVRLINGKITVLRRARGYTPLPVSLKTALPSTLAVGGQQKNTIAINQDEHIILSQHLGDLDSEASRQQFQATISDLKHFFQIIPTGIIHDLHAGYSSSQLASHLGQTLEPVQHHYAHALSCLAEHGLEPPVLGIVWDGSGLGDDNTLWGGEFLRITRSGFERFAHFRTFSLPGGVKAIQEPRRAALGLRHEISPGNEFENRNLPFTSLEQTLLSQALNKSINCPRTSSLGRLFDGVASLLGLCHINHYEGQAAMMLESLADSVTSDAQYDYQLLSAKPVIIDWQPMLEQLQDDIANSSPALIAMKFHNTLADIIRVIAIQAELETIVLSGGCFQNALLVEKAVSKLKTAGFDVYCHEKIPPNDGGLALGQLYALNFRG